MRYVCISFFQSYTSPSLIRDSFMLEPIALGDGVIKTVSKNWLSAFRLSLVWAQIFL